MDKLAAQTFPAIPVTERVYWVGAVDWGLRNFHGYETSHGSTYNAYLILADKVTLVDTVKAAFHDEMMARIASVIDPQDVRYVISNHAEMDHSGSLPRLVPALQPEKVFASAQGARALAQHFHWQQAVETVADGQRLDLGNAAVRFTETRMLHWPDSMFTYVEDERVLFSNDAFGMHLASSQRFNDELEAGLCHREAAKYYANILLPFSPLVKKLLQRLPELDFDLGLIAPDHGPIWRDRPEQVFDWYRRWADQPPQPKAVVPYCTMWGSTERMARAVSEGLHGAGLDVLLMPLDSSHRSEVATEVLDAGALVVGAPTMNGRIYPQMADVMTYLQGLRPRNLVGAAFGSYGWGGEAVGQLEQWLRDMQIEVVSEGLRIQYVPDAEALSRCQVWGRDVAAALQTKVAAPAR